MTQESSIIQKISDFFHIQSFERFLETRKTQKLPKGTWQSGTTNQGSKDHITG